MGGHGQKWPWLVSSWDPKICCMLRMSLWIELIFWMLTVMQEFLVKPILYSISLSFECRSTFAFVRPAAVAGRILWNRVCPSFHSNASPCVFLKLYHLVSLNFGMVLETLIKFCLTESDFLEKLFFAPKIGEMTQNRPKNNKFKEKFGC